MDYFFEDSARLTEWLRMDWTADWSAGDGPSVEGPLAALIFVMAGRKAPLEVLSGEGKQTLEARL